MHSALKMAAVVVCCTGWAFADSAPTNQTPPANAGGTTILAADQGNGDPTPAPDGMRRWRDGRDQQDGQAKKDGKDDGDWRPGPMMGMRGRMGGWMMQRGREDGQRGQQQSPLPKGLMLGVTTDSPDPALASQLNLPDGIGLVVEEVLPNSSAQRAGLEKYDVLEKLDDQLVVNVEQVGVLIRMHKPGDEITLTVIRHGKAKEVSATLGESNQRPDHRDGNRSPRRPFEGKNGMGHPLQPNQQEGPKSDGNLTPDTSGTPSVPPALVPHHHKQKDNNEDSGFTPAPATQPAALQATAETN